MKKKTDERLKRKWTNLPKHHIDASVVLELLFEQDHANDCTTYLNRAGYKYRCVLTAPVLGEITKNIIINALDDIFRENAFVSLLMLIEKRRIEIYTPKIDAIETIKSLVDIDSRFRFMDALHLAAAINNNATVFATLDTGFNVEVGRRFNIKVRHPREL